MKCQRNLESAEQCSRQKIKNDINSPVTDNQDITDPEDIVTNLNKHLRTLWKSLSKNQNRITEELKNFIVF